MKFLVLAFLIISCTSIGNFIRYDIAPHVHQVTSGGEAHCTSFDIRYNGKVRTITNAHCCEEPTLEVNGKTVEVVKYDRGADLCELKGSVQTSGLRISNKEVEPMDEVHTVGFPANYGKTIRHGYITNSTRVPHLNSFSLFQTTMHVYGGASGSPVINNRGEVVGVIAITNFFKEGIFIRLDTLKSFLDE